MTNWIVRTIANACGLAVACAGVLAGKLGHDASWPPRRPVNRIVR
jgi:hypothetical protein